MTIIAIDSSNKDLAGAIVYWRLSTDHAANGDAINQALRDAGLDEQHLLNLPTPRRALRRAMQDLATGPVFMRSGKQGDGGLYLVRQEPGESGPEFKVLVRAHLSTGGLPDFDVDREFNGVETCDEHSVQSHLVERFWHYIENIASTDVSSWLIAQAHECDALSMRDTGGIYFIPRDNLDDWRKRIDALHEHTNCRVHLVPAMNAREALDAVLQSLLDECSAFTDALGNDIVDENLGARALQNRAEQAKEFLGKLDRYANLLGPIAEGRLAQLRDQIETQQHNAVEAALSMGGAS